MAGRGVGDLKKIANEQSLNAELITVIKELNQLDHEAGQAMSNKQYTKVLQNMPKQLSLLEKIEHFSTVKLVRLEYTYKEIDQVLRSYEEHVKSETKKLNDQERAIRKEHNTDRVRQIHQHIHNTRNQLHQFNNRIKEARGGLKQMKKHIKERCKRKIVRIRKAYHFA